MMKKAEKKEDNKVSTFSRFNSSFDSEWNRINGTFEDFNKESLNMPQHKTASERLAVCIDLITEKLKDLRADSDVFNVLGNRRLIHQNRRFIKFLNQLLTEMK